MGALQIKRNPLASIPTLAIGEMYLATDSGSESLYIGTASGNKIISTNYLYTAQSVLASIPAGDPQPITIAANSFLGRAAGNVADIAISASQIVGRDASSALKGLSTAEVDTLLGYIKKSLVDAKGDLLVGTADNTVARIAAGTNTYVLTADSGVTEGIKWAAAPFSIQKNIAGNLYVANSVTSFIHLIYFDVARTISSIKCGCVTASTGADIIMNFLYHATAPASATTIFTTAGNKPTIADTEFASSTSGVPDTTSMAAGSFLLVCIEQVGSTIAGADLSYTINF